MAVGPGMDCSGVLSKLLGAIIGLADKPVVIDADGLNNLCQVRDWPKKARAKLVLTPHPGEAKRLWASLKKSAWPKSRRDAALELARSCRQTVVLKGAGTVVTDGSRLYVNKTGNPGMATGGSGDVLTGVIAALIGQGLDVFEAAVLGVYLHGRAGDLAAEMTGQVSLTARDLLAAGGAAARTSQRTDKVADAAANEAAFERAREMLAGVRAEIIAPREIVEAVRIGLAESFQAGMQAEQQAFARCMDTLATRNRIYLFFATRKAPKVPELADAEPREIAATAVVGMGSMGTGIAHALIIAGLPVVVRDQDEAALEKGLARIQKSVQKRVASGKLAEDRAQKMLALIATTTAWKDIAGAHLVIEAVFEDVAVKRAVLAEIEAVCSAETIVATNTSTISLDELAEGMAHPERLVGMHFFNPAHRMPLVEVIRREATPAGAIAAAMALAKRIRKTPVLVRNREGFLVNRIFIPYFKEAFWLVQDGADPRSVDAAMVDFGFAMGPLALIDMAGLDILAFTDAVMRRAFERHGPLSPIVTRLVEAGCLGQKTGSGVYRYAKGDYTPHDSEAAHRIIAEVRREAGGGPRGVGPDEITERLVLRMVNEAFYVLRDGIAQRESDIDVAMVLGTGFPDFRGGILKYARDLGIDVVAARLEALAEKLGERFRPCELPRDMKGN